VSSYSGNLYYFEPDQPLLYTIRHVWRCSFYGDGQRSVCCTLFLLLIIICLLPLWRREV